MSKAMQLMGSKISLVSKSEIRYEGTLFTLNPNESTLALAKVRMFGTENRPTDNPVAARDEVFEFIIFRGQDIKDIRLCEAPLPQPTMPGGLPYDPAIVQHSVPGVGSLGAGLQQPASLGGSMIRPAFGPMGGMNNYPNLVGEGAAPGGPLGQLGNLMGPGGLGGGLGGLQGGLGLAERAIAAAASELPLSPRGDALHMPPPHPDHFSEGDQGVLSGASARSTNSTPVGGASGSASRKSPVGDGRGKNDDDDHRRTSSRGSGGQHDNQRSRQNDSRRDRDRQDRDQQNQQRGGNNGGRSNSRGRSRGGNNGGGQGSGGQNRGGQNQGGQGGQGSFNRFANDFRNNRSAKGPLKFDEDYDFESANTKFEELKSKMGKMKIGGDTVLVLSSAPTGEENKDKAADAGEAGAVTPAADGEAPTDALVSSGSGTNEDGTSKTPDSPVKPICYDKTRSFFDSISCEAVERSKGNTQRTDWRQERKLNAETFGLPAQRRGGYNRGGRGYGGYGGGRGYGGYGGGRGGQQRDGREGGFHQSSRQDGGYQSGRNGGRSGGGGGGNYRSGRGGNYHRDGLGENVGQSRGYPRRNWQQQQQQDNRA